MITARGKHWTDERIGGRSARRVVRNHANYETSAGIIAPTSHGIAAQSGPPSHWSGQWDFSHAQIEAPLQVYTRDSTDPGNRALMGINPSHRPDVWATWKAVDANDCEPTVTDDGATITYAGLWDGTDWRLQIGPHKVKDFIELNDLAVAPRSFDWTIKLAPGCSLDPRSDGVHLLDGSGVSHGKITYPVAWDDSGSEEAPNVSVAMVLIDNAGPLLVMRMTVADADFDAARAAGSGIVIDPTVVISGTTDIEDASAYGPNPDINMGGRADVWVRGNSALDDNNQSGLVRVAASAIPAGTINLVTFSSYKTNTVASGSVEHHRIVDANDWVEGTQSFAIEVGSCCANYAKYNTQTWAGGLGSRCLVSGTDYDADASPPTQTNLTVGAQSIALPNVWFSDWRDSVRVANGFVMHAFSINNFNIQSTEGTNPPTFTIDYTTGPTTSPYYYNMINNRRR
jgi:hypothetical protein